VYIRFIIYINSQSSNRDLTTSANANNEKESLKEIKWRIKET